MEFLNKVELRGVVGRITLQTYDNEKIGRMSVVTNSCRKLKDGTAVIDTTWHNVVIQQSKTNTPLENIQKGDKVELTGRFRAQRYTTETGEDRVMYDIEARSLTLIKTDTLIVEKTN